MSSSGGAHSLGGLRGAIGCENYMYEGY
jgi:hypothetical protein